MNGHSVLTPRVLLVKSGCHINVPGYGHDHFWAVSISINCHSVQAPRSFSVKSGCHVDVPGYGHWPMCLAMDVTPMCQIRQHLAASGSIWELFGPACKSAPPQALEPQIEFLSFRKIYFLHWAVMA